MLKKRDIAPLTMKTVINHFDLKITLSANILWTLLTEMFSLLNEEGLVFLSFFSLAIRNIFLLGAVNSKTATSQKKIPSSKIKSAIFSSKEHIDNERFRDIKNVVILE